MVEVSNIITYYLSGQVVHVPQSATGSVYCCLIDIEIVQNTGDKTWCRLSITTGACNG